MYKNLVEDFKAKHEAFINGCDIVEAMNEWDRDENGEMDAFYSSDLATVMIRLIAIDGNITESEVEYLNETLEFEYTDEELCELYRNSKEDIAEFFDESFENGISLMRKINPSLADAYKELLKLLCQIAIECDGVTLAIERDEVERLISLCD